MRTLTAGGFIRKTGRMLGLGLAAALLATIIVNIFPATASAAVKWYDPAWKFRKQITIDHTLVAHDLEGFPVLVSLLSDADLANGAQNTGDDILFTGDDGFTKLFHEVEYYQPANGKLVAWVNVPYLSAEKDTVLFMYYGNPESSAQQDPKSTWAKDFSLVQHLEETGGGIDYDSTANANHGTYTGSGQNAKGIIDGADLFDGLSGRVRIPYAGSLLFTSDFTLETWVCPAAVPQYTRNLICKSDDYILQINGEFRFYVPGVGDVISVTKPEKDTWVNVAAVFHRGSDSSKNTLEIYINGKLEGSMTGGGTPQNVKKNIFLGSGETGNYFNGTLDEVRISGAARPKEWLVTSYTNQAKPEAFYKLGEQEVPTASPTVRTDEAGAVSETGATLRGYLINDGGEACTAYFIWDTDQSFPHPSATPLIYGVRSGQSFSAVISHLNKGTHYYYRAIASNGAGMVSGSILYLLTRPDPPVTGSFTAVAVTGGTQIDLSWQKGEAAQKTMVRAQEGGYPGSYLDGRQVYFDEGTACSDTGLRPDTTYYYRAWSQVSGSEQWSGSFIEITVTTGSGSTGGDPVVTVGGDVHSVNKLAVLMPYLVSGAALVVLIVSGGLRFIKKRRAAVRF